MKDQITCTLLIYRGWLSPYVLSMPLGFQCKKDFFIISAEMEKSYGSVLKELRLVDDTGKTSSTAQLLPYIAFLLMEAKGAKTLSLNLIVQLSHNWKQAANLGKKNLRVWIPSWKWQGALRKAIIGEKFWFGNCSGQCDESLLLRK